MDDTARREQQLLDLIERACEEAELLASEYKDRQTQGHAARPAHQLRSIDSNLRSARATLRKRLGVAA